VTARQEEVHLFSWCASWVSQASFERGPLDRRSQRPAPLKNPDARWATLRGLQWLQEVRYYTDWPLAPYFLRRVPPMVRRPALKGVATLARGRSGLGLCHPAGFALAFLGCQVLQRMGTP